MLANENTEVPKEQVEPPKTGKEKYTVTTNSKTGLTEEEEKKLKENLDNGFTQKMNQKIKIIVCALEHSNNSNSILIFYFILFLFYFLFFNFNFILFYFFFNFILILSYFFFVTIKL